MKWPRFGDHTPPSVGIIFGTTFGIMHSSPQPMDSPRLVSALCVGQAVSADLIAACYREHVAVVVSARGMQVLRHFHADAVICLAADPNAVMALADSKIPVVVLASDTADWAIPGVTVIGRDTPVPTLARLIREVATGTSSLITNPAA